MGKGNDDKILEMDVKVVTSIRGKPLLCVNNYKFSRRLVIKSGETYWACANNSCTCVAYTIGDLDDEELVVRIKGKHHHKVNLELLNQQISDATSKKKSTEKLVVENEDIWNAKSNIHKTQRYSALVTTINTDKVTFDNDENEVRKMCTKVQTQKSKISPHLCNQSMKDIEKVEAEITNSVNNHNQEQTEMALKTALPPNVIDNFPQKPLPDDFVDESDDSFQLHLSSDEDEPKEVSGESNATIVKEKKNGETEEDILNKFENLGHSNEMDKKEENKLLNADNDKTTIAENGVAETPILDSDDNAKIDSTNCEEKKETNVAHTDPDESEKTKDDTKLDGLNDCNKSDEISEKTNDDTKVDGLNNFNKSDEISVQNEENITEDKKAEIDGEIENTVKADDALFETDDTPVEGDKNESEEIAKIVKVESEVPENITEDNEKKQSSQSEDGNCEDNEVNVCESDVQNESTDNVPDGENEMNTDYLNETVRNEDNSDNAMDVDNADNEAEKANILKDGMDTEDLLKVTDVVKSIDEVEEKIDESSNSCSSSVDEKDDAVATAEDICDNDVEEDENDIVENDLENIEVNDITENDVEENDIIENEIENEVSENDAIKDKIENADDKENDFVEKDSASITNESSDVNDIAKTNSEDIVEDSNETETVDKITESDILTVDDKTEKESEKMVIDDDVLLGESDSVVIKDSSSVPSDEMKVTDESTDCKTETTMDCDSDIKDVSEDVLVKADVVYDDTTKKRVNDDGNVLIAVDDTKQESESKSIVEDVCIKNDSDNESTKSNKRPYSESEVEEEASTKKVKLSEESKEKVEEETVVSASEKIKHLKNLSEFMRSKDIFTLSREDLEEYCMQKICECLVYKSDLGEMQHKIKQYELMIEHWRKEFTRMTKQTKDLEIVHKKLLHELKQKNDKEKTVQPVKITRSVGLQVKLDSFNAANAKRKVVTKENVPATPQQPQNGIRRTVPMANRQTKIAPKSTLLGQALQKDNIPSGVRMNSNQSNSPTKAADKGVIDLTDEDDKKIVAKPAVNSPKVPLAKGATTAKTNTASPQNIRFVTSAIKNTNQQSPQTIVPSNGPRLMYLVQATDPQIQRGGVMLKIQSPNGVIAPTIPSTPNSTSTVVVSQPVTSVRNGTVRLTNTVTNTAIRSTPPKLNPTKHPAPLPSPPASQVSSRKPILPKPHLSIRKSGQGIVLSWKMPYNLEHYESIASYQLYAYQETNSQPSSEMWRKVGDIKALALPMACTLTQFADGNKYYFSVRAVDVLKRIGNFSDPEHIML